MLNMLIITNYSKLFTFVWNKAEIIICKFNNKVEKTKKRALLWEIFNAKQSLFMHDKQWGLISLSSSVMRS